ncbi:hypothetical protein N7491_011079 [Penicillium cf. griseofulvum]|uniref:Carrier domain-containing protein n=1 Tax=Penicillium cf. griseofulvum TaxID=2972120 RepID=A0A9W9N100_9EURO|nr:hypothetical protein N7472_001398 [Penicillium cf. griseofulvum]KAJ5422634.1 hypothetical protein N7491_011079 [Penicillium cf. griseofulvum]KAJ5428811.1 hypothetical protein N7445_010265 [Penicillium cf. griseofulvum]
MGYASSLLRNEYDVTVAENHGLGQLLYQQVLRDPEAVAVVDGTMSLTYRELHSKAVLLANELRQEAFDLQEPVGIIVQHGIWGIVTQVSVIYAGGSCATMDPTLPDQQIDARLQRLKNVRYILVDQPNSQRTLLHSKFRQIVVDNPLPLATKELRMEDTAPPAITDLEHRTHVIHTSGTTSEPKAVQIAARSILEVVFHSPFEPVIRSDVVAHVNNTSFDVSLFDIWAPLLRGARIAVLQKITLLDLPLMADEIKRLGISVMATTTALLNLAAATFPNAFASLRMCWIGGEAANISAIETIFRHTPPQNLINAYGPTECCVLCLAHRITEDDVQAGRVSIGKPIGRTTVHIRDPDSREPVKNGDAGELWVAGPGVSPGYVNRPEANKTAFVLVDLGGSSPVRMYRTGDIVRCRPDGQIDYVGRRDNQVKVRGFRIELEAVDAALMKTGHFSEAVSLKVDAVPEGASSHLVAYAVPTSSVADVSLHTVTEAIRAVLPDYMVPQIQLIDKMPLNSHAKVDRKLLAEQYRQRWGQKPAYKTLCVNAKVDSETRTHLATLWASILGLPTPDFDDSDDFFQLGGTSLQASWLISRIRTVFQLDLSLLTLYDNSTLGNLTLAIGKVRNGSVEVVRNERERWIADTYIADVLPTPTAPVVDWNRDTEGRVFFTGATGFVGAFLLADMLRMPNIHQVGCLVRAVDSEMGLERLRQAMAKYDLWEERFVHKLLPLPGLLEDEYLGLGMERFEEIANWASVIFHLGAKVNYTQTYTLHRPANTIGTFNIIRLAVTGRVKAVHYVSSISCFGPTGYFTGAQNVKEDESLLSHIDSLPYDHGYAQSQWVVEQLLRRLIERGFPVAVYRPGFITGHSQTGACNPDDFFSRLIQACSEMGYYPQLPNQRKEFVPVDYVNAIILHIASTAASIGHTYHIVPPSPSLSIGMDDSMDLVSQATGSSIIGVPYQQWIEHLTEAPPLRLLALQPMLTEKVHNGLTRWELYENMPVYDTHNTEQAMKDYAGGIQFPQLDGTLMSKYLGYLKTHS